MKINANVWERLHNLCEQSSGRGCWEEKEKQTKTEMNLKEIMQNHEKECTVDVAHQMLHVPNQSI